MIEELNEKNEAAKNTISPATSEHPEPVENKTSTIADENNDDQETSTEDDSVEEETARAVDGLETQEEATSQEQEVGVEKSAPSDNVETTKSEEVNVAEEAKELETDPTPPTTDEVNPEKVEESTSPSTEETNAKVVVTVNDDQVTSTEDDSEEEETARAIDGLETQEKATSQEQEVLEDKSAPSDNVETANSAEVNVAEEAKELETDSIPTATKEVNSEKVEKSTVTAAEEKNEAVVVEQSKSNQKDLSSDEDQTEKEEEHHEEEIDYTTLSKEELVEIIKGIAKDDDVVKADKILLAIKPHFDKFRNAEREAAKTKFVADGGEEDDFEFKHDELSNRFDANYRLIKDRKSKYFQEKEKQKDANLKKKQDLLEKIREFVDSDETNISFEKFKTYQNEWKNIGMVPNAYNKTLWANYNALMDRFYDHRSIYFELKELDRRKNLKAKLELCEKAEALVKVEQLNEAIKALNELHDEFKHLGPVPKEEQEALWQRFKSASDATYAKRKDYVEHLKVAQEANLVQKLELVSQIQAYTEYKSDRIKEWNEKTKEVLALQKLWEAVGGMPRERAKEVNKLFWAAFKTFFHNKGDFFKALDAAREGNLQEKNILIEKAQELKDSTDWMKTSNELIKLQKAWKETGPVPEKVRNSTYQQFKEACDFFFEQKRSQNKINEGAYEANLDTKKSICEKIEELAKVESNDLDAFRTLQDEFNNVGFVPKKDIGVVKSLYADAVDKFINAIPAIDNEERQRIRIENQLNKLANDPNAEQKIFRKEQTIRKQIGKVENDISLWKNNMEFFASSKNADKVRDEFNGKIDVATKEMLNLKQQLRVLRSME